MRVLVFEQWGGGHYTNYLHHLVPAICELASEVTVALGKRFAGSADLMPARTAWSSIGNLRVDDGVPDEDPALPWKKRLRLLENLRAAARRSRPDYIFVPSGDAQTLALGLLGPLSLGRLDLGARSECILHTGYGPGAMSRKNRTKRAIYNTAFEHAAWTRSNFVNFLMYERFAASRVGDAFGMVPDPVPELPVLDRLDARRQLGIAEEGRIVGFVGMMDHRKAIPELLRAFRAARIGGSDRLLLAGTLDPAYAALIESSYRDLIRENRLIVINRRLSDAELQQGLGALDVACLPYYEFPGLSSLMLKAVAAGRPVLVHDFGWMRAVARRFDVANRCNIYVQEEFAAAIAAALESAPRHRIDAATRALLDYHRPANFVGHAVGTLRGLVGRHAPEPPSWESVMDRVDPERRQLY